ncbi:UPF0764 protein C16orf89 homolog [Xenia sp. Carnegie-2017]|uniref:UPF0764 protein C16orf89 homolog n=1 Tax=Xenia sp. Carnegie-2017 TaxID=2897299 RepID=UPI001F03EE66|nr:UPF0764 protein C16orf89 homolog [Xenia sp. Carnegie-2017]
MFEKYLNSTMAGGEMRRVAYRIRKIHQKASSINDRAQVFIKHQSPKYYAMFRAIVDKPWKFYRDFQFNKLPAWNVMKAYDDKNEWSDEEKSDKCMSEVIGTNLNNTKCTVTKDCMKMMTNKNFIDYGPTHQVLFLTLAIIFRCETKYSPVLKQLSGYDVHGLIQNRCGRVMSEMLRLERLGIPVGSRDLYIEQVMVCGMHGFAEFLTFKRLYNVLSWQRKVGCFGKLSNRNDDVNIQDPGTALYNEEEVDELGRDGQSYRSMRKLLVDVIVDYRCSAHESGVAAGLLGLYTKWLVEKMYVFEISQSDGLLMA